MKHARKQHNVHTTKSARPRQPRPAAHWIAAASLGITAGLAGLGLPSQARAAYLVTVDQTQNGGVLAVDPTGPLIIAGAPNPLLTLTSNATTTGVSEVIVGTSDGNGRLSVQAGSVLDNTTWDVSQYNAHLGRDTNSTGTATVTGNGSLWQNSGDFYVGDSGNGTLNVTDGGKVTNTAGYIGTNTNSIGTATVSGAGSLWQNSEELYVGDSGNGTLNVTDGGKVTNATGYIGYDSSSAGSTGTATVTGTGSLWHNNGDLILGGLSLTVAYTGNAALTISDGGAVLVDGTTKLHHANTTLNLNQGGNFNFTGGTLNVTGTVTGNLNVPDTAIFTGAATVDGNLILAAGGTLAPGNSPGTLTVQNDAIWQGGNIL